MAGRKLSKTSEETCALVEKIAEAVIRLSRIANADFKPGSRKHKHRNVMDLLDENDEARTIYMDLIRNLAVECTALTESVWNTKWRPAVEKIVEGIAGVQVVWNRSDAFLKWGNPENVESDQAKRKQSDNFFRYPNESPRVEIRVGSIHSVKGETHTATLVLETFYRSHHLKAVKEWLLGKNANVSSINATLRSRLRLHYVAMTRPTHLLCLAMRSDALSDGEIAQLKTRRWRVARVTAEAPEWL